MKLKKKLKSKLFVFLIIVFVVGGIGFVATQLTEETATNGMTFEIPIPSDFSGQTQLNSNASIECKLKASTYAIDSNGNTVQADDSPFLQGNPIFLQLTSEKGEALAGYVIIPKINCYNTFNDSSVDPTKYTLIVKPSTLTVSVVSKLPDGNTKTTEATAYKTPQVSFPLSSSSSSGEKNLSYVSFYDNLISDDLPKGDYTTLQQFVVTGNLVVAWQGYPNAEYKIPIKQNDIPTYLTAKIQTSGTFTGVDSDGDGIRNEHDKCPDAPENYNGFEDSDGCPDTKSTAPTPPPTSTTESPIIYTQCLADSQSTWSVDTTEKTQSFCMYNGLKSTTNGVCGIYDSATKQCLVYTSKINKTTGCVTLSNGTTICPPDTLFTSTSGECYKKDMDMCVYIKEKALGTLTGGTGKTLNGKVLWQVDVKDSSGGTFAFTAQEDTTPFVFNIPLKLTGGKSGGAVKEISEITVKPLLKLDVASEHKLTTTKAVKLDLVVTVGVGNPSLPTWVIVKTAPIQDFREINGASAEAGIPLGNMVIKTSEIESKISSSLVGIDETKELIFKVNVAGQGNYVDVAYNDGTIKQIKIPLDTSGTVQDKNTLQFEWTNLKIIRGTGGSGGDSGETKLTESECLALTTSMTKYYWVNNTCIHYDGEIGGTGGDNGTNINPETGATTGGMCKLDTGAGDSNNDGRICQICTDDKSGIGGFPCDDGYRADYCGDTTQCGSSKPVDCDSLFADTSDGCVKTRNTSEGDICPEGLVPHIIGDLLQCNPLIDNGKVVGGNNSDNSCPSNVFTDSGSCIVQSGNNPNTNTNNNNVCSGGACLNQSIIPTDYLIAIGVAGLVIGIVIIIIKRRR